MINCFLLLSPPFVPNYLIGKAKNARFMIHIKDLFMIGEHVFAFGSLLGLMIDSKVKEVEKSA